MLLHHLGTEGRRIYDDLPEMSLGIGDGQPANPYEMSLQMLEKHFTPKISIVFERHKLFSRVQGYDEDVLTYVAALRGLAVMCDFQNLSDSLIHDQIVRCTNSKKVKERLLSIDPSLEECIQIVRSMEHTETWMKEIEVKGHIRDSDKENTVEVKEFKGKKNVVADCLSRLPINESPEEVSLMCEMEVEASPIDEELALGQGEWEEAIVDDEEYGELKRLICELETIFGSKK
ncbi:hypothetical protein NDU88_006931 [Pleurodeles waltl]|uniref:Uncharacterized protein n=1 Tax=Pleurodeles waltl TaxID=8319 RepID=A0AAV7TY90_PLEWA|nr:hypothetical protein NDU88_006931 [Pleurodeles waltl]